MLRDLRKLFEYERKKRPELADLAGRVEQLSDAQIREANVPMPWMRDALRQLKADRQATTLAGLIDQAVVDGTNPDPTGMMCEWIGAETFLKVGRTSLLVSPGTLLWIDQTGMWIDTIFTSAIDPKMRGNVTAKRAITRSGYNLAVREQTRQSTPKVTTTAMSEPIEHVRFFRPG